MPEAICPICYRIFEHCRCDGVRDDQKRDGGSGEE